LLKEFRDVVIQARKVFDHFNMLGSCVDVIGTLEKIDKTKPKNGEEIKIPIPFKLLGMHEALEKNFDWIVPENPFDESSEPKSVERGSSKTCLLLLIKAQTCLDTFDLRHSIAKNQQPGSFQC
jgi:hypothetical protein